MKGLKARPVRWTIGIICVLVGLRALGGSNAVAQLLSRWLQSDVYEEEGMVERRLRWLEEQRVSPGEVVPEDALLRGWYQRLAAEHRGDRVAKADEAIGWRSIGPAPDQLAPSTNTGRVRAIAVHPLDPTIIYVGSAGGGVWKSTDDGASYRPVTDRQCSLNTGAIAIDPVNPRIVYVGTGEPRQSTGCGVLRSIDEGETWTSVGGTTLGTAGVTAILIDPAAAGTAERSTVYVSTTGGFFRSFNSGGTFERIGGTTGGELKIDPRQPETLYAIQFQPNVTPLASMVRKSTDRGTTWRTLSSGLPERFTEGTLATDPRNPGRIYAVLADTSALIGLYRSADGGESWTALGTSLTTRTSCAAAPQQRTLTCTNCWFNLVLAVDPRDGALYYGHLQLSRSTDEGQSWVSVDAGSDPCAARAVLHVDHHSVVFDRAGRVLNGSDGGIFRSSNGAVSWESLNTNLSIRQFYPGVSTHPTDPSTMFAGAQDQAVLRFSGGVWQAVFGGDGGFTSIDQASPNTVYVERQWTVGTGSSVSRSDTGGAPGSFVAKMRGIEVTDRAQFIPPLVIDPSASNRLAFGTYRVYLSEDRAEQWRVISPDLKRGTANETLSRIAFAPAGRATIWVGSSGGGVWRTADDGGSWVPITTGLPARYVSDIALRSDRSGEAYLSMSGFGTDRVFKTTDDGASWRSISQGLPNVSVNALLIDRNPGTLFAGTDVGVYRTENDGQSWEPFGDNLPNVRVTELVQNTRLGLLIAATYGRGLFAIGGLCTSDISPRVVNIGGGGGAFEISVAAPCAWEVNLSRTAYPWVRLDGRSSEGGRGVARFSVEPNPSSDSRTAQINVAAELLVIRQAGR